MHPRFAADPERPARSRTRHILTACCVLLALATVPALAMLGGTDHSAPPDGIASAWNLPPEERQSWSKAHGVDVLEVSSTVPANVLYPNDTVTYTYELTNDNAQPVTVTGTLETLQYALVTKGDDMFSYEIVNLGRVDRRPISVSIPAKGYQQITVSPTIPAKFGGYVMIVDLGAYGRHYAGTCIRTMAPSAKPEQFPVMTLDDRDRTFLDRIGIHAVRLGTEYVPTTSARFEQYLADLRRECADLQQHHVTAMLNFNGGGTTALNDQIGGMAHQLNDDGTMNTSYNDVMWIPAQDPDFAKAVEIVCAEFGWPKGPVTAVCLFNEPWEGGGISGWMADMPRYREAYKAMADGVLAARKNAGVQVLVGGGDSTSNALDKLFGDSSDEFLPIFDYVSMHYQGLDSRATLAKWADRKGPYGRVRFWDTESWVANTDDRIAPMLASWRAAGYDRLMGVDAACTLDETSGMAHDARGELTPVRAIHPGAPAAAVAATAGFLGSRPFTQFLFSNGLPWVMVFDGLPREDGRPNPEDGTVVVAGDLLTGSQAIFRSVKTLKGGARMIIKGDPAYALHDFYGNPVPPQEGRIVLPLNAQGFFLRGDGKPGSFAKLLNALRNARIEGLEPVEILARDMTAPIAAKPALRLSITNVLNRPVTGTLTATLAGMQLDRPAQTLTIPGNTTKNVALTVTGGAASADNTYALEATFDAGADGRVTHAERMHCNVIARQPVTVDGNLDDWQGVIPIPVASGGNAPSLTEQAWYPNKTFTENVRTGFATGFLAYDARYCYFAAKVADDTPCNGMLRWETLDEDQFFFPATFKVRPETGKSFAARWTGQVQPRFSETYTFTTNTDDGVRLWIDGKLVIDNWTDHAPTDDIANVTLRAGTRYAVKMEYYQGAGGAQARLFWQSSRQSKEIIPMACLFTGADAKTANGLKGEYFTNRTFSEPPKGTRIDTTVDFDWNNGELPMKELAGDSAQWTEIAWPKEAGARRYLYRKEPLLPSGNGGATRDNIQLAFTAIPSDNVALKGMYPYPKGTMPRYIPYQDTDYEYALNPVAPQYGGGTEIWRLQVPGMSRKHFYPRQPKSPYDGPVKDGKLVVRRDGNTRIVECAIPWTEMPWVKKQLDAGNTVKFSFRVNDNDGPSYELANNRSVSKANPLTFHCDWGGGHWANEIEFGFAK